MGPYEATASRYASVSMLLWVSVINLGLLAAVLAGREGRRTPRRFCFFFLGLLFVMVTVNSALSIQWYPKTHRLRMCGLMSVLRPTGPNCLGQLYPDPERLRRVDIPQLWRLKLSVFAE